MGQFVMERDIQLAIERAVRQEVSIAVAMALQANAQQQAMRHAEPERKVMQQAPYKPFPWGKTGPWTITQESETVIKVWKPMMERWGDDQGAGGPYVGDDTEVTFSGDGDQYIVWRWSEADGLEILDEPQNNWPVKLAGGYAWGVVHQVNLTAGRFSVVCPVQFGVLPAPIFTKPGA